MAMPTPSPIRSQPSDFSDLPWSAPSRIADNGTHDGYSTVPLVKGGKVQPAAEPFEEYLSGVRWAVISKLAPGGYLLPHRDKGPHLTRVQIPLEAGGWYWDEHVGTIQMTPGANVVRHHLAHAVWNDTDRDRIHLVIDRDPQHSDGAFQQRPVDVCPELVAFLKESR